MDQCMFFRRLLKNASSFFKVRNVCTFFPIFSLVLMLVVMSSFSKTWQVFTLEECINAALEENPALKVAEEKVAEATAKYKESKAYFLPKLTATASATQLDEANYLDMTRWFDAMGGLATPVGYLAWNDYLTGDTKAWEEFVKFEESTKGGNTKYRLGGDRLYNMSLSLVQPIFMGFKLSSGRKAAKNGLEAVKKNAGMTKRYVILHVKKIFFSILQAQQHIVIADTSISQLKGIVHDLENMREQGIVGDQEVMNANVILYNIQLMKIKAENAVVLAKSALCVYMGIELTTPINLNHALVEPADMGVGDLMVLIDKAQKSQSEIKSLEYQREAFKNMVTFTKSGYYPSIFAMGNYNYKNPNRQYKDEFYACWDISIGLKMNIFDWGELHQKVVQAKSRMRQVEGNLNQYKCGIALQVEKNYLSIVEAFKRIDLNKKAMEKAQLSYTITHDKFQVGMAKNADLLNAQRVLTQAKINFYNGVAAFYIAHAELEHLIDK